MVDVLGGIFVPFREKNRSSCLKSFDNLSNTCALKLFFIFLRPFFKDLNIKVKYQ